VNRSRFRREVPARSPVPRGTDHAANAALPMLRLNRCGAAL